MGQSRGSTDVKRPQCHHLYSYKMAFENVCSKKKKTIVKLYYIRRVSIQVRPSDGFGRFMAIEIRINILILPYCIQQKTRFFSFFFSLRRSYVCPSYKNKDNNLKSANSQRRNNFLIFSQCYDDAYVTCRTEKQNIGTRIPLNVERLAPTCGLDADNISRQPIYVYMIKQKKNQHFSTKM